VSTREISQTIRREAIRLGFADCGFSRAEYLPEDARRLRSWIERGHHAGMGYMENHFEKRTDPARLVEGARSVVSVLYNYFTAKLQRDPEAPVLSKYAYGEDYHFVMKEKLGLLLEFIREQCGEVKGQVCSEVKGCIFVDSAPVLDRAWARRAGLGWIGKNSSLISRKAGSFVFIGEIILDVELEYNQVPETDFCGSCTLCIDSCPTRAILTDRTLDSVRCISYQTIENRGTIPGELEGRLANRFFGCDICQDVCPWNRKALPHSEPAFEPPEGLLEMRLEEWLGLDREQFNNLFRDSAVKRAGYKKVQETISFLHGGNLRL